MSTSTTFDFSTSPIQSSIDQVLHDYDPNTALTELFEALKLSNDEKWDPNLNSMSKTLSEIGPNGKHFDRSGWVDMSERIIDTAAERIEQDIARITQTLHEVHPEIDAIKYVIWAGMGGSAEIGKVIGATISGNVKIFVLDTTDPFALDAIFTSIAGLEQNSLEQALLSTIVIGVSMGMTSEEPVINMVACEETFKRYEQFSDECKRGAHFWAMTLKNSTVHEFLKVKGWGKQRVPIQLDGDQRSTLSGRNSYNSRVALWHLALLGGSSAVQEYLSAMVFSNEDRIAGFRLGAAIVAAESMGMSQPTLVVPSTLRHCAFWLMQQAEESLGKNSEHLIKVSVTDSTDLPPNSSRFLIHVNGDGVGLTLSNTPTPIAAIAKLIHVWTHAVTYVALCWGRDSVGQYSVESYKSYVQKFMLSSMRIGGFGDYSLDQVNTTEVTKAKQRWLLRNDMENGAFVDTPEWDLLITRMNKSEWRGVTMYHTDSFLHSSLPIAYCQWVDKHNDAEYSEITVYNDCVHGGGDLLHAFDKHFGGLFARKLPNGAVNVTEGPRDNHSRLEMSTAARNTGIITLATSSLDFRQGATPYPTEYLPMQVLATFQSYLDHGRNVVLLAGELDSNWVVEFSKEMK